MDRGRVGEDRGSKKTDGCPLTLDALECVHVTLWHPPLSHGMTINGRLGTGRLGTVISVYYV
jgi:hypothetical protein